LVPQNQNAFLKGRLVTDASLLAHELVRDFSNPMRSRFCMEVDLQKALDTIDREFVYYMLHCMGFSYRWINWIKECLASASWVRQGDPLSPYLL